MTELTPAEKLTALGTYLKALKPMEAALRAEVTKDMGDRHVEKVGAYLPDGEKLGSVGYRPGNKTAKVTDPAAALRWCLQRYPEELVQTINPAFLAKIIEASKGGAVGDYGVDPIGGEMLPFIKVVQGDPFVTVTTTKEGVDRMTQLAHGFAGMLESDPKPPPPPPPPPSEPPPPRRPIADPTLSHWDTGILPNAHRCAGCTFTTADVGRMDDHLRATGHWPEGAFGQQTEANR